MLAAIIILIIVRRSVRPSMYLLYCHWAIFWYYFVYWGRITAFFKSRTIMIMNQGTYFMSTREFRKCSARFFKRRSEISTTASYIFSFRPTGNNNQESWYRDSLFHQETLEPRDDMCSPGKSCKLHWKGEWESIICLNSRWSKRDWEKTLNMLL